MKNIKDRVKEFEEEWEKLKNATRGKIKVEAAKHFSISFLEIAIFQERKEILELLLKNLPKEKTNRNGEYGHPEIDKNTGYNQAIAEIKLLINNLKQ